MENAAQLALPAPAVTPLLTEETYSKPVKAFQAIGDATVKIVPVIYQFRIRLYKIVAPPKLYHLAYHSKKGRTRKKNLKLIKRYWEEFINGCDKIH